MKSEAKWLQKKNHKWLSAKAIYKNTLIGTQILMIPAACSSKIEVARGAKSIREPVTCERCKKIK